MGRSTHCDSCHALEQISNIGPAPAKDLRLLWIEKPQDLCGCDPFELYQQLCNLTETRHDACVHLHRGGCLHGWRACCALVTLHG